MSAERDLYRLLFEAADEAVLLVQNSRIKGANASALVLLGCSREEILGQNPLDILAGDQGLQQVLNQALSGHKQCFEGLCGRPDGTKFPARVSLVLVSPDLDHSKAILKLSISDLTETRELELKLRTMSQIVEQSPVSVVVTNTAGEIEYVNPKFTRVTGYTAEEAIGQNPRLLKSGEKSPGEYKDLWATITAGGEWQGEFHNRKKNGDLFWEHASISPIQNQEGEIIHFLAIKEDITERKRLEEQQRLLLERRGRQVRLGTQIAQEIAGAADLPELYRRLVNRVREQFGYYYAQVLRYEPLEQALVLVAGSGETGEQMLAEGHRMAIGTGLIGAAAASGDSVLRADVALDRDWRPNRLLPETRGELAVPIKLGGQVLGVLDVQSNEAGALDTEDQLLLEGLCGQIAIAIESTRLRQEMEERLRQLTTLQRLMSQEAWQAFQAGSPEQLGYLFEQGEVRPVTRTDLPETGTAAPGALLSIAKPVAVRGEVIGRFGIFDDPEQPLSEEDQVLLEAISLQVAEAMERARLLEQTRKRAVELQAVAEVGTAAATILTTDTLLQTVVDLTKTRFGLYHVHIYLLNEAGDTLVLAAGAGEAGRVIVEQGWQISLDHPHSLVALTARTRKGIIVNDVRQSPDYLSNPHLPNTRSEMAVPLVVGERLFGVLDVQADTVNYFTTEDLGIQATLATQVGVALQNARHYQQTRAALDEVEATQRRYTLQAWETYITQRRALNIEQVREGVSPLGDVMPPEAKQAIALKQTAVTGKDPANGAGPADSQHPAAVGDNGSSLVVPLTLRGEVIGVLGLQEMDKRQWMPEEIALVEAISEQLTQAAENLRLIDETQERAAREARVNQISEKIQAAQSLEEALQIAASEVGRSLRAPQTTIQIELKR